MFSSSVAGGSICLGCQLRAVTRRAAPALAVAAAAASASVAQTQNRARTGRRRHYASEATTSTREDVIGEVLNEKKRSESSYRRRANSASKAKPEDDLAAILNQQSHLEESSQRRPSAAFEATQDDDWGLPDEHKSTKPAYSRWGTPPPGAFEDEEYDPLEDDDHAQRRGGGWGWRARQRLEAEANGELMEELVRYMAPEKPKAPTAYRKGNTRLVEDRSKLSIDTLGRAAEVIVLREGGDWHSKPYKQDERPADKGLTLDDHVDQEAGLSMEVIMENINELQPEHHILPTREFKDIFDTLMSGFTSIQLESYVERHQRREEEGDETPFVGVLPEMAKPQPWIVEQSVWTPEVKGAVQEVDLPLKGYILKSMPPKQRLVMQLMRECWGMSVQELMDGQGVLEVRVRDQEFTLLTLGNQRWLDVISRVHLAPGGGKSIQLVKSRQAIRIIAPKVVAEACMKALNDTFQKIKWKILKLDQLPMKFIKASMLEELGKITNSIVEVDEMHQAIKVTWIDIRDDSESKLEDLADVVFRLLLSAYPPPRTDKTLTVYPDVEGKGKLVEQIGSKDKLPWMERRVRWARLCLPLGTESPRVASAWPLDHSTVMKYMVRQEDDDLTLPMSTIEPKIEAFYNSLAGVPLGFPKPPKKPQLEEESPTTQPTPSGWKPFRVRSDAVFGHILHLNDDSVGSAIHEGTEAMSSSLRTLNPVIPPVKEMDIPGWVPYKVPAYMTSLILMRFVPDSPDPLAPQLELRIKTTDDEIIGLHSLRAIAHTTVSDILLPAEQVDVRATQRLVAELPGNKIDGTEGMQPLLQFLRDAKLKMAQGRLVTPPRVSKLGLPKWMFYRPEVDVDSPFLSKKAQQRMLELAAAAAATAKDAATTTIARDGSVAKSKSSSEEESLTASKKTTNLSTAAAAKESLPTTPYAPATKGGILPPSYMEQRYDERFNVLRPVSYMFAGLELHRSLETTYDGWTLSYTSIEAGHGGGRRAELSLEAVPGGDRDLRRQPDMIDSLRFMRSVYKLARGLESNPIMTKGSNGKAEVVKSRIGWVGKQKRSERVVVE